MNHPGWMLVLVGLIIAGIGLAWVLAPAIPWLGKLPGDIVIQRGGVRIYFPIVTCLLVSLLLSGIAWLVRHFFAR